MSKPYKRWMRCGSDATLIASGAAVCMRYANSKLSMRAVSCDSAACCSRWNVFSCRSRSSWLRCWAAFIGDGLTRLAIGCPVGLR